MDLIKKWILPSKCYWIEKVSEVTLLQVICPAFKLSTGIVIHYFIPGTNITGDKNSAQGNPA